MGGTKDNGSETPSEAGWYPDPWSATGTGERYFDGKKWGTSERPLARHSPVVIDIGRAPSKRRGGKRARPAATGRFGRLRGRIRNAVKPILVIAGLLGVGWVLTQVQHHDSNSVHIVEPEASAPARPTNAPPPSKEEASQPLGTPAPVPAGPGKYEILLNQPDAPKTPVAYDPCRPIHYVVNPAHEPSDGAVLVHNAIGRLQTATGLHFIDDGVTTEVPDRNRKAYQPKRYNTERWAPVLIAWSNEVAYPDLAGYIIGEGGSDSVYATQNRMVYVTGQLVLDYHDLAVSRMRDRRLAQGVILHELGHLVGLAHTSDRSQLMFSEAEFNVNTYGAGDLRGLALVGKQACYPQV